MNSYHPLAEKFGLSDATLDILCGISQLGRPCTQKELCEIWYLSKQTVNSCTKQLSAKGLITAAPSPNNFREKLITLTPAGRELCRNTAVRVYERECAALDTLSPEERQRLILLYKKYVDAIENEFAKILEEDI